MPRSCGDDGAASSTPSIVAYPRATPVKESKRRLLDAIRIPRSSLKTDLEILKLLDPADSSYQTVKKAVDKRIARLYSPEPTRPEADMFWSWVFAIFGVLWALGFSYGTFVLLRPAFTWWAVLTGYLAFAGLWLLVMAARGTLMGFLVSLGGRQGIAPTNESTHR